MKTGSLGQQMSEEKIEAEGGSRIVCDIAPILTGGCMRMEKICPVCGKEFDQGNRKYCSKERSKEGQLQNRLKLYEEKRKAKEEKAVKQNALQETARKAAEAGMSYGRYIAMQQDYFHHHKGVKQA